MSEVPVGDPLPGHRAGCCGPSDGAAPLRWIWVRHMWMTAAQDHRDGAERASPPWIVGRRGRCVPESVAMLVAHLS